MYFQKELSHLKKEKMPLIVMFIIPILTVILLGFAFQSQVIENIPMAVIDYDQTNFSRQLIQAFSSNDTFQIQAYPENEKELNELIENSFVRVAMIIPKGFYNDVQTLKSPTVLMIYDGSHMSITSVAKSKAMEILLTYKAGATISHLQARLNLSFDEALNITQAFKFSNRMLYNPTKSFRDFLTPAFLAGVIQSAIVLLATVSIDHKIYEKNQNLRRGYALKNTLLYGIMGTLSMGICIFIQISFFKVTFKGHFMDAMLLTLFFTMAVSSFSVLISTIIKNRMIALIGGGIIFIPNSIMAGTTWPLYAMPTGYQGAVKFIPFIHFVVNLRDIYLKGVRLHSMHSDLTFLFIFSLISIILSESVLAIADISEAEQKQNIKSDKAMEKEIQNDVSAELQEGLPICI